MGLHPSQPAAARLRALRAMALGCVAVPGVAAGVAVLAFAAGVGPALAAEAGQAPVKLAVFDFELEDASPTAVLQNRIVSSADAMDKVSSAARRELAQSGRYALVDVGAADAPPVRSKSLRNCDGCEAAQALGLGAQQSLIGVLIRATATDYYLLIRVRDARTGRILVQESANFAGSEEGWPSGARMLIRHQVLPALEQPPPAPDAAP